jgi:hypothetical protein
MFEDAQGWRGTGKPPAARVRAHHVTVTVSTHGLIKLRATAFFSVPRQIIAKCSINDSHGGPPKIAFTRRSNKKNIEVTKVHSTFDIID